jgi:hypothetical protein
MNDSERLAIAQAIYNNLGKLVSTKDPDSLRAQADREYKTLYEQTGAKSFDVRVNGSKVGTYSVKVSKAKPAEERKELVVTDRDALDDYIHQTDPYDIELFVQEHSELFVKWSCEQLGIMPDGCTVETYVTPATEPAYMGGTLKVNPEDVANAINGLDIGIYGLLEGE